MTELNIPPTSSLLARKWRKLRRSPKHFFIDSSGYQIAHRSWQQSLKLGSFLWVIGCFAVACLYFGVIASDRYVSRSDVIIKQADQIKMLPDTLSMLGLGGSNHQDVLLVQEYLLSLASDASREAFLEYYREHLSLRLDEISGVLIIELQAFDPVYGQQVVALILKEAEQFINTLSHKVAKEQLRFVEQEVDRAHHQLQQQKSRLLAYQDRYQLLSPESTSSARLGVVSKIEAELVSKQAELKQLRSYMRETAPAVIAVQSRVDALNQQLAQENDKLTRSGHPAVTSNSMNSSDNTNNNSGEAMNQITARYLDLQTEAALAADLYKTGLISLEQARVEAYRKLKHLLVVSQPSLAEEAEFPRRLYNLASVAVLLCLLYGLMVMGLATLREHQD